MIKALKHFGLALCLAGTLLVVGCNNQTPPPEIHQGKVGGGNDTSSPAAAASSATESPATGGVVNASPAPASEVPTMPPGGMTRDPRSITEVEGKVVEVQSTDIFVQKGSVNLKFHLTPTTVIKPDGKKLAADQNVKIEIEHVTDGMNAKEIDIQ